MLTTTLATKALPTTIYWTAPTPEIQPSPSSLWFAPHVRAFSVLSDGQLASDAHAAIQFTSFAINVPKYLSYLLTRFHEAGGKSIRHTLNTSHGLSPALEEAAAAAAKEIIPPTSELGKDEGSGRASIEIAAFVNATGIGAKALVGDESVYPTRGQTVLVRGEAPAMRSRIFGDEEGISYVIPRPGSGTTVLGGVKEAGRWDEKPDEQTTKSILARCRDLAPELLTKQGERETGFEVLGVQVGLRPSRVGGARVELERLVEKKAKVVHCYGHSGTG
ncbi:MAG: hypothetical protein M1819_000853 [Sarea resinae]|nr:MAG: hypothetical protein M1819_000853 [Sarea resinae]